MCRTSSHVMNVKINIYDIASRSKGRDIIIRMSGSSLGHIFITLLRIALLVSGLMVQCILMGVYLIYLLYLLCYCKRTECQNK